MNLFNQPVSQSFQTVVSLNSDNTITNGTGSIVSLLNVTASNAISSNVAVSSSYSVTSSYLIGYVPPTLVTSSISASYVTGSNSYISNITVNNISSPHITDLNISAATNIIGNNLNLNSGVGVLGNGGNVNINAGSGHVQTGGIQGNVLLSASLVGINQFNPQFTLDVNGDIGNSSNDYYIGANGDNSYLNNNGGYVGIGTNNPQYNLDVSGIIGNSAYVNANYLQLDDGYGNTNLQIQTGNLFVSVANGGFVVESNGNISDKNETYYIGTNGNNSYLNSSGGYVGIGTSNPQYTLDVAGDINFTGNLFYNGGQNWISSDYWGNTYFNTSLGNGGIVAKSVSSVQAIIQVISTTQHVGLVTDPLVNGEYSCGIYDFNYGGLVIGCLTNGNASVPNKLGVGTPTPYYELDVAGTTRSSNGYQLPDHTTISSPEEGLLAYNFTTHHTTVYNGTTWI